MIFGPKYPGTRKTQSTQETQTLYFYQEVEIKNFVGSDKSSTLKFSSDLSGCSTLELEQCSYSYCILYIYYYKYIYLYTYILYTLKSPINHFFSVRNLWLFW